MNFTLYILNPLNFLKIFKKKSFRLGYLFITLGITVALLSNFSIILGLPTENFDFVRVIASYIFIIFLLIGTIIMSSETTWLRRLSYIVTIASVVQILLSLLNSDLMTIILPPIFFLGQILLIIFSTYTSLYLDWKHSIHQKSSASTTKV